LVSILLAIIPLVEIIGSIPIGFYVDNGSAKSIGTFGTMFLIFTPIIFVLFSGIGLIDIILLGIGSITTEISLQAYVFNIVKKVKIKYIGLVYGLAGIGGLAGAASGGFLFQYYSLWYLLAFISGLLLVALALFVKYLEPREATHKVKQSNLNKILGEEAGLYKKFKHFVTGLSMFSFIFGFFEWAIWLLVPILIIIKSADIFYGGVIYGVICLPFGFGSLLASHIYKKRSKRRVIACSIIIAIIAMLSTSFLLNFSVYILVILLLASFTISTTYLTLSGYILERDRRDIAEFYVFETVSYDAGGAIGILISGFTVLATSITAVSVIFSVLAAAFLAYFLFVGKDVR
jgi:predicted MFS family arabinose efflux permease